MRLSIIFIMLTSPGIGPNSVLMLLHHSWHGNGRVWRISLRGLKETRKWLDALSTAEELQNM